MKQKILLLAVLASLLPAWGRAQFLGGIFNQKNSERKLLMQQIAALELYKHYVKTGYRIVSGGVDLIREIKSGDFDLHRTFFSSLKSVNPKIRKYKKVTEILYMQVKLVRACSQHIKEMRRSGMLKEEQLLYIARVLSRLLDEAAALLDELLLLTTDGKVEMKDDERIQRIDQLYEQVQGQYSFFKSFSNENLQLAISRRDELREIEKLKMIQGID